SRLKSWMGGRRTRGNEMADDPIASMVAAWKQASDTYIQAWGRAFEAATSSDAGNDALQEMRKTSLGSEATMRALSREAAEPLVMLAGGVPLSEFRRLADQVQTLLLRLDRIDDTLRELRDLAARGTRDKKK